VLRAIAVDIGGTTTKIASVTHDGKLAALCTLPTQGPAERLLDRIVSRVDVNGAVGAGVSVAGFVDESRSAMVFNPNLSWLEHFPLRNALADRLGLRVEIEADSNAACLAESRFGVGRAARRFLCLTLGTGVGGAMVVDGAIVRLAHGGLGDVGHVSVSPFANRCSAGCSGCAEAMISASAIEKRYGGAKSVREIIQSARAGEEHAKNVLTETGKLLGVAIASMVVIFFPDVIALAGGTAEAGSLLVQPAQAHLRKLTGPHYRRGLRIRKAALGWKASLVGAAIPVMNAVGT
jgi:glucokinase